MIITFDRRDLFSVASKLRQYPFPNVFISNDLTYKQKKKWRGKRWMLRRLLTCREVATHSRTEPQTCDAPKPPIWEHPKFNFQFPTTDHNNLLAYNLHQYHTLPSCGLQYWSPPRALITNTTSIIKKNLAKQCTTTTKLSLATANVNSLTNKIFFVHDYCVSFNIYAFAVLETWLHSYIKDSTLLFNYYSVHQNDFVSLKPKHGVCLYITKSLHSTMYSDSP